MSEKDKKPKEKSVVIPNQKSADDTSNQNDKVSVDPSGQKYIRAE